MYQAIHYDRNERKYYLRDDEKGWMEFQYQPTYYRRDEEGEYLTLFGDRVSPFRGKFDWSDPDVFEKDIDKELLVLRDIYYETDDLPKNHNIVYLDIEIEMLGALNPETIREAKAEITAIALIDVNNKRKICLILDKNKELQNIIEGNKETYSCSSESELLNKFLELWKEIDPTICVHYNGDFFDIPYLYFRLGKILGYEKSLELSPINKVIDNPDSPDSPITIGGVNCLDFMYLVKKYIMKEEPSYKLGDIGTKYAKLGKIEYKGNLNSLFKEDKQKFIDYNLRDVEIIEALEDKLKFIQLTILISHLCHTPYESIYYNTVLNEGAILTYLKRKGIVAPNKPTTTNPSIRELNIGDPVQHQRGTPTIDGFIINIIGKTAQVRTIMGSVIERPIKSVRKKDSYAGGYLKDPIPGLYSLSCDEDFTSLYPSIIKSLNLGIETLVGRIVTKNNYEQKLSLEKLKLKPGDEILEVEKLSLKTYELKRANISVKQLIDLIEENNWTISASGAFFRTDIKSISCEVLEDWFEKREHYRGLKKKAGKAEDWENYKLYDLYQLAFKILQNALYGTYAINGWRFTDGYKICSAAITNSGQRLTQESIIFVNNKLNTELGTEDDYIIASDTDSMFIQLSQIMKHRYPKLNLDYSNKEERNPLVLKVIEEIQSESNLNLNNISRDLFNIKGKHYFELKQEMLLEKAYWAGKRRYAMWVTNKEGVDVDDWDFKGLDVMKSNFPPLFREFGEGVIKKVLLGSDKNQMTKEIVEFKKSLNIISWEKLLKPTGLKKMGEYIDIPPRSGEMFTKLKKKCPANTKAAIYYNDLLRFKKLHTKYPTIELGDKIYIAYLKQNPYRINTIAFTGYNDPPEIKDFIEKFIDKNEMFDSVMKNKLENLYKDLNWGALVLNENVGKFFSF
jgi:DNA polymerase elongation subunit (family B)